MKHVKYNNGDIFYIPISTSSQYDKGDKEGNEGKYIPNDNDQIVLGQVIYKDMIPYLAITDNLLTVKELENELSMTTFIPTRVLFLQRVSEEALKLGHWPIVANRPIHPKTPLQAYKVDDEIVDYKDGGIFKGSGHRKEASLIEAISLHEGGVSYSPKDIEESLKYHFDFTDVLFHYSKKEAKQYLKDLKPKTKGRVWKVFPEFYDKTWVEKEEATKKEKKVKK